MTAAGNQREDYDEPVNLPPLEIYVRQFRLKFGREMTQEEKRFYALTRELLKSPPEDDDSAA